MRGSNLVTPRLSAAARAVTPAAWRHWRQSAVPRLWSGACSPNSGAPHRHSRSAQRLPAGVADNEALRKLLDRPRRGEAGGHRRVESLRGGQRPRVAYPKTAEDHQALADLHAERAAASRNFVSIARRHLLVWRFSLRHRQTNPSYPCRASLAGYNDLPARSLVTLVP